jgi:hypothetical protein
MKDHVIRIPLQTTNGTPAELSAQAPAYNVRVGGAHVGQVIPYVQAVIAPADPDAKYIGWSAYNVAGDHMGTSDTAAGAAWCLAPSSLAEVQPGVVFAVSGSFTTEQVEQAVRALEKETGVFVPGGVSGMRAALRVLGLS